jgi:uncharacterized membrane protein YraQ (UPF0718 family)
MLIPTLIMGALALALLLAGYSRGEGQHLAGVKTALTMTLTVLPLLIFAFIVAGMVQALVPAQVISKWIGAESGARGILLGSIAGGLAPGGPYVSMPIAAALVKSGASTGTVVAFMTGWSLWAVARLPMEAGILGWRLMVARLVSTAIFPPLAGFIAQMLFSKAT